MNELILEELKYDLEEKVRKMMAETKEQCYKTNKQAYENSRKYMECVMNRNREIQEMQKTAKDKLLFMQMSSARNPNFSLTQSTIKFIQEYGLNPGEMLATNEINLQQGAPKVTPQ